MKKRVRKNTNMRADEWILKNSIKQNKDTVVKVLHDNGFKVDKDYRITQNCFNECDIFLRYMAKSYKIEVNSDNRSYNLLQEKLSANPTRKNKYRVLRSFTGDNIIADILKFIKDSTSYKIAS
ncbi:hypothetical protein [Clostridium sp. DJ247]|uniref:hypothetical protein n=1 Tax=Clostridium sp. DJ247 TaxID=2726188 RepID=UPI001626E0F4|nr:hypothetical protein [Clostridium sp. DJ247]MBC2579961.1 hypothetical protein [Clostridium sp. DJ247]